MEDLAVEVCGENGAYYKAFITDVHEDEVTVAFENEWQPESKFPFQRVRLPPAPPKDDKPASMTEGQEVEVFSRANEQEACGWWRAVVKMTKGDFHVVEYLGWETTYTEIVPSDRLRIKNTNQPITKGTFHQFEIPVPEDVQEYAKVDSAHKEFKKAIGAAVCRYNPEKKTLLFIVSLSSEGKQEGLEKIATMLSEMHFRNLLQKALLNRTAEAARQLESTRLHSNSGYGEEFTVREDRLAIGAHGANIQNARKLDGITGIDLEECSRTFKIFGEMTKRKVSEIVEEDESFEWKIKNFSAQDLLAGAVKSPSFKCCGANFHLEVSRKLNVIHLQLVLSDSDDLPRISKCSIGFRCPDLKDWYCKDFDAPVKHTDITYSISVDKIMKELVENKVLIVACEITASILKHTVDDQPVTLTASNEKKKFSKQSHTTLSENFRSILEDSRFADVTLKVGEHTFQAHKAILSSRSKVFEGMFQSGMKENEESVVEMAEMEPSTLKEMMQYIYAGAIGELSVLEAIDLYVGADRYDLQELKGWCRELILKHISSDLVCRVAVLADLHTDEELAKASKRVFQENSKTIMASESWREFGKQNPALQTDLLESALLS